MVLDLLISLEAYRMIDLLEPKIVIITDGYGKAKEYYISKLPAFQGRNIMYTYTLANLPKIGSPEKSMEIVIELMAYVAVNIGTPEAPIYQRLNNEALINNHVSDWEALAKIEKEMLVYNNSFFRNGQALSFFEGLAQTIVEKIIGILTVSSGQSSQQERQPFTN